MCKDYVNLRAQMLGRLKNNDIFGMEKDGYIVKETYGWYEK